MLIQDSACEFDNEIVEPDDGAQKEFKFNRIFLFSLLKQITVENIWIIKIMPGVTLPKSGSKIGPFHSLSSLRHGSFRER